MNAKFYSCLSPVSIALGLLFCNSVAVQAQSLESVYQAALTYDATVAGAKTFISAPTAPKGAFFSGCLANVSLFILFNILFSFNLKLSVIPTIRGIY